MLFSSPTTRSPNHVQAIPTASAARLPALAPAGSLIDAHTFVASARPKLFMESGRRSLLSSCAENADLGAQLRERAVARCAEKLALLRHKAQRRRPMTAAESLAKSHNSNLTGITKDTNSSVLFGADVACILEPTVTEGRRNRQCDLKDWRGAGFARGQWLRALHHHSQKARHVPPGDQECSRNVVGARGTGIVHRQCARPTA